MSTIKAICRRFDRMGSAADRRASSARPKSARSAKNIGKVQQLTFMRKYSTSVHRATVRTIMYGRQAESATFDQRRRLVQCAKFSAHIMVSAGICFGGKRRLHLAPEKVKVNTRFLRQGSAAQAHRRLQLFAAKWLRLSARRCFHTFLVSCAGVDWSALSKVHQER